MTLRLLALMALVAVPASGQVPSGGGTSGVEIGGGITTGVQQLDNSTNSSKLTEYRDLRDEFFLPRLAFSLYDPDTRWFVDLTGANVSRNDQTILATVGRPGVWNVHATWIGVPHNFSNKAVTPYIRRDAGLFGVPATVPITFKRLATTNAADAVGVVASDNLIAAYQSTFLAPTPLATQTNFGRFGLSWLGSSAVSLGLTYDRHEKSGLRPAFAPIGDRPPRTLNVQITEPVDYRTDDLTFSAEHSGRRYQLRGEYLFSAFANRIDTLRWQNLYTTATPGADFDVWDRLVATTGARPLPPDNRYHNATVNAGVDLPGESRLMGTFSYGRLQQNEPLLPYATLTTLANPTLPRATADAAMNTVHVGADYVMTPLPRLNVRGFFRHYGLDNDTPSSQWQYVTSDTANLNGTVAYVNKRVSVPYAWDRRNAGGEAIWRLPYRSALTFGYELESIGRDHREADTTEHVLRAIWRIRPVTWMSFQGRYTHGLRNGGDYENEVTHEGYWYSPGEATDGNNPALTFDNHPDMRRFDVSDRRRHQFDLTVNLTPRDLLAISAFVRVRDDDFESDVRPSQPLLDTDLPERSATSPGDQLGWLKDRRLRYGVDLFVQPRPRVALNAFLNYDLGTSVERSLEFNENNKQNPGAIATAELGPWTRAGSQWTADFDDRTWSGGLGATLQLLPGRLAVTADYTLSFADVDIAYAGYGVTSFDGTPFPPDHQFAFSSPPTVNQDLQVANVTFEIPIRTVALVVGYSVERYKLEDWQQGSTAPWVEPVGADTLLRDTSRSWQWGNRLFNLGTYLAPTYTAHIGFAGIRYRF